MITLSVDAIIQNMLYKSTMRLLLFPAAQLVLVFSDLTSVSFLTSCCQLLDCLSSANPISGRSKAVLFESCISWLLRAL